MTTLVPIVVAVCILAVAALVGYTVGFDHGSSAGRKLAELEQARAEALERQQAERPNLGVWHEDRLIAKGVGGVRVNPTDDGRIRIEYP